MLEDRIPEHDRVRATSERKAQAELNLALRGLRGGGKTKIPCERSAGCLKRGVVEILEELSAKLHFCGLAEPGVLDQGKVKIPPTRARECIAA